MPQTKKLGLIMILMVMAVVMGEAAKLMGVLQIRPHPGSWSQWVFILSALGRMCSLYMPYVWMHT